MSKSEFYIILHNIRSAYNIGSIFRTADAAGVKKIYICGYSPTPDDKKVVKTSLGAEKGVSWERWPQTWRLLEKLSAKGGPVSGGKKIQIVALEQTKKSVDYRQFRPRFPMALILGNEKNGLSKEVLQHADKIIAIPMYGKKESLNVAVAAGIAIYKLIESRRSL